MKRATITCVPATRDSRHEPVDQQPPTGDRRFGIRVLAGPERDRGRAVAVVTADDPGHGVHIPHHQGAGLEVLGPPLEMLGQTFLQRRHRLGQRVSLVVLENDPAVVDGPDDEAEALLIPDLDVAVPLSEGEAQQRRGVEDQAERGGLRVRVPRGGRVGRHRFFGFGSGRSCFVATNSESSPPWK